MEKDLPTEVLEALDGVGDVNSVYVPPETASTLGSPGGRTPPPLVPTHVERPCATAGEPIPSTATSNDTDSIGVDVSLAVKNPPWLSLSKSFSKLATQYADEVNKFIEDPKHPDAYEFMLERAEKLKRLIRAHNPCQWPPIAELSPKRFIEVEPAEFEWILPDFLSRGVVGLLFGEGGSYKSLAALWLVMQRALNVPENLWLDHFAIHPGRSMFLSAEDVSLDLHHRCRSIVRHLREDNPNIDVDAAVAENCLIMSREQWVSDKLLFLVNGEGAATMKKDSIIERVKEFRADLVIIETLSRISGADENSNQLGARVIGVLEEIRDATGASVVAICHVSKAARNGQGNTHGQSAARGASSLVDNARWALWFKSLPPTNMGFPCLEVVHAKSFRSMRAKTFRLEVLFPRFVASTTTPESSSDPLGEKILEYVTKNPGHTRNEVLKEIKGTRADKSMRIGELLEDGFLEQRTDGKKRPIYAVKQATVPKCSEVVSEQLEEVLFR